MGLINDSRNLIESLNTYLDRSILDEKPVINQRPIGKIIIINYLLEKIGWEAMPVNVIVMISS